MGEAKRRVSLPVLKEPASSGGSSGGGGLGQDETPTRSPTAWIFLGALIFFVIVWPASILFVPLLVRMHASLAVLAISSVLLIALAGYGAGWTIARFGKEIGPGRAALAGAIAGAALWAVAKMPSGFMIVIVAAGGAALGGWRGKRRA